ncbi:DUF2306 domain-containing protein [Peristeroidobacter agariperforans]|uniref:DUF2306 domain-containing protein n=1 Tax=Peristeroidobacter agariperforans TaxID=268404 RepID=UPI00101BE582|nr:DUF2306 domain-containing protein [Peristeroidobacter agariperforans]
MSVIAPQDVSRSRWLQVGWVFMLLGAMLAAANAILFMNIDAYGHPGIKSRFIATEIAGWMHTLGGAIAVVLGPWQFLSRVRVRWPRVHVWTGRVYLVAVLSGALGGLYFAPTSVGGNPGVIGFGILAVFWLYTGAQAYVSARRRDFVAHRRWMIRNYSLTFAAVTLRLELGLLQVSGLNFDVAFPIVAWSSWVLNWLAAEMWLRRQ